MCTKVCFRLNIILNIWLDYFFNLLLLRYCLTKSKCSTPLPIRKHVNITVDKWILESTRPQKHVPNPESHIFWHTFAEHDSVLIPFYLLNSFHNSIKTGTFFLEACFAHVHVQPVDLMNTVQELMSIVTT